jgi:hypothetical protein
LIALDVFVFEDEGLDLAAYNDVLDIRDFRDERPVLWAQFAWITEIRTHALIERGRLANVKDSAIGILMKIDAGLMWKRVEHRLEFIREFYHSAF